MKVKNIFFILIIALIAGCSKENDISDVPGPSLSPAYSAEKIYNETGCKPKDVESIKMLRPFVDDAKKEKYLYGSRDMDDREHFWIAKYNSSGETIWEVINKDSVYPSHAYAPTMLKDGNIAAIRVTKSSDITTTGSYPIIINSANGDSKSINIFQGYHCNYIVPFEKFFFCGTDQNELNLIPGAKKYFIQISNTGEILNEAEEMYIPDHVNKIIWINNVDYISTTNNSIKRSNILKDKAIWSVTPDLPDFRTCEIDVVLKEDTIIADYRLTRNDNEQEFLTYKIAYATGEIYSTLEDGSDNQVKSIFIEGLYDIHGISEFYQKNYYDLHLFHGDQLMAKIKFDPSYAENKNIIWSSSDPSLVTITPDGILSVTTDVSAKGNVILTATAEDGGATASLHISVDDVFLSANGLSFHQVGNSFIVTFISRIATSPDKTISIGSIMLLDHNRTIIQILSARESQGQIIVETSPKDVSYLGLNGSSLFSLLSQWKFYYTYKLTGESEYKTKEVNIKANLWGNYY